MELFSYNSKDLDGCKEVDSLNGNVVYVSDSGMHYLHKKTGSVYQLNSVEASDTKKFLENVVEYNL